MSVSSETFLEPIAAELRELERRLHETVAADLGPIAEAMEHIVSAGGKRIRPALLILSAKLGDADIDHVYNAAMGIEFIHTATLIHDDLIDDAETRRGLATIHAVLGANPAIIVGDYYFGKGANLLSAIGVPMITEVVSATVMKICMGELQQLTSKRHYEQPVEDYYTKIERKTATMLSAACHCGAIVAGMGEREQHALERYGRDLGIAFQIADDVLDYTATEEQLGKPTGADLRQGTVTLPLMLALKDPSVSHGCARSSPTSRSATPTATRSSTWCGRRRGRRGGATRPRVHRPGPRRARDLPRVRGASALESICDYVVERRT